MAAEGDSFVVSAACTWTSALVGSSRYGWWRLVSGEVSDDGCAIDRTTSPLQIGHVRRRVVNHGVLWERLAS